MGNFLGSVARNAVGLAPYAEQAMDKVRQEKLAAVAQQQKTDAFNLQQKLGNRTLNTPVLGDPNYATAMGDVSAAQANAGVPAAIAKERGIAPIRTQEAIDTAAGTEPIKTAGAIATAKGVAPIHTEEAINTAKGVTPIHTEAAVTQHKRERLFDNANQPPETPAIMPGTNADGTPAFFRIPKTSGPAEPIAGITPKPAGAGGGQNAPTMAAAKANIESARKIMDEYESKLKAGSAHYGVLDATQGALASSPAALNAKGPLGAVESLGANLSSSHLQSSNPDLARYMTAKKYVAEAILNTHKRPNQTQYEIEQELSGIGPNPSAEQIDMAKARRDRMYDEVFNNPNAGGTVTPKPSAGGAPVARTAAPTHAQQLWDAAVAKHGQAKVLQEFGPRPSGDE